MNMNMNMQCNMFDLIHNIAPQSLEYNNIIVVLADKLGMVLLRWHAAQECGLDPHFG